MQGEDVKLQLSKGNLKKKIEKATKSVEEQGSFGRQVAASPAPSGTDAAGTPNVFRAPGHVASPHTNTPTCCEAARVSDALTEFTELSAAPAGDPRSRWAGLLLPITGNPGTGNAVPGIAVNSGHLCGGLCARAAGGFDSEFSGKKCSWVRSTDPAREEEEAGGRPGPKSGRDRAASAARASAPWGLRPCSRAPRSTSGASPPGTT